MKRIAIALCLALATASCTDKSHPADSTAKKQGTKQTTSIKLQPKLPGTFALERSVRNQLNQQKQLARDRAKQFDRVIGR